MVEQTKSQELKSIPYELFILMLSLLAILNLLFEFEVDFITPDPITLDVLLIIDMLLIVFFLFDFLYRFVTAPSKSVYFFKQLGWADMLSTVPILRIFRLFRIARVRRLMREFGSENLMDEALDNRASSALYTTIFCVIVMAEAAAILVLRAESHNPDANLTTAGDAVWWVLVTITTVGYGDYYPITMWGRVIGVSIMFSGLVLFGVLASYLARRFLAPPKRKTAAVSAAPDDLKARLTRLEALLDEQANANAALREEVGEIKQLIP